MLQLRKSADRGRTTTDWLESRHTFSFANYRDPQHVQLGPLRVLNEDRIAPASGFGPHPHRDMEILTWVLDGVLEHRDDRGNTVRLEPGRAQLMRAGRGIWHSETNPSADEPLHLLQIWILPDQPGLAPGHHECAFTLDEGGFVPIASSGGRGGGFDLRQDASIHAVRLAAGERAEYALAPGRRAWLQLCRGTASVGDVALEAGDGVAIEAEEALRIGATDDAGAGAEALLFDLA